MRFRVHKTDQEWQAQLTPQQYSVCRRKGTELPFTGQYCESHEPGIYHCACCKSPLFRSENKFDSGTGWPSYTFPINEAAVAYLEDHSYGMRRTEVVCATCGAHLGHVFDDGPPPTGKRFCINSICLELSLV